MKYLGRAGLLMFIMATVSASGVVIPLEGTPLMIFAIGMGLFILIGIN